MFVSLRTGRAEEFICAHELHFVSWWQLRPARHS